VYPYSVLISTYIGETF